MNTPKKYKIAIEILKLELIVKKNNLAIVNKKAVLNVKKQIKNLKAVLIILEGR